MKTFKEWINTLKLNTEYEFFFKIASQLNCLNYKTSSFEALINELIGTGKHTLSNEDYNKLLHFRTLLGNNKIEFMSGKMDNDNNSSKNEIIWRTPDELISLIENKFHSACLRRITSYSSILRNEKFSCLRTFLEELNKDSKLLCAPTIREEFLYFMDFFNQDKITLINSSLKASFTKEVPYTPLTYYTADEIVERIASERVRFASYLEDLVRITTINSKKYNDVLSLLNTLRSFPIIYNSNCYSDMLNNLLAAYKKDRTYFDSLFPQEIKSNSIINNQPLKTENGKQNVSRVTVTIARGERRTGSIITNRIKTSTITAGYRCNKAITSY